MAASWDTNSDPPVEPCECGRCVAERSRYAAGARRLKSGEARVGDGVTPAVPITTLGGEPSFSPGAVLAVREVKGANGCLVRVEDTFNGKTGVWSVDCFSRL